MKTIRYSIGHYLPYSLWLLISWGNFFITPEPSKYISLFMGGLVVVLMIKSIFKPYFEIRDNQLIIREQFRTRTIVTDYIDSISLQTGPFSESRINLKNGQEPFEFDYYAMSTKDFERMQAFMQWRVDPLK